MFSAIRNATLACVGVLLIAAPASNAVAATRDSLADPGTILQVNGRNYSPVTADILFAAAQQAKPEITWREFLDGVVENQVMARQAIAEMGKAALMAPDKVGFPPDIVLEDQYFSLVKRHFFKDIDATVRTLPGASLAPLITRTLPQNDPALNELLTLRDLTEVRLTPAQLDLARKTVLATVTLPDGKTVDITWHDLYRRENVQGRTLLMQEKDFGYLNTRIQTRVETLFLDWWMEHRSGINATDRAMLRTMLEEKFLRENHMLLLGVVSSMHEDLTPTLEKMQKVVTRKEIADWYEKHKDEFRQIEKVRARHIRCATEADCKTAREAIEKGMEFSEAARKFSIAPSRNAKPAGDLGWIHREAKNVPWLQQLAFIQPPGEMTVPIRTPEDSKGNAAWEVVLVDERVEGFSKPDSETVSYQAVQEIAKRKLIDQYIATRDRLKAQADVRRNPSLIRERVQQAAARPGTTRPTPATPPRDAHGHSHGHRH